MCYVNAHDSFSQISQNSLSFDLRISICGGLFSKVDRWRIEFLKLSCILSDSFRQNTHSPAEIVWQHYERIFSLVKLFHSRLKQLQIVVTGSFDMEELCQISSLSGFGKTLHREHPNFTLQVVLGIF